VTTHNDPQQELPEEDEPIEDREDIREWARRGAEHRQERDYNRKRPDSTLTSQKYNHKWKNNAPNSRGHKALNDNHHNNKQQEN
jgi:hypothetical protein